MIACISPRRSGKTEYLIDEFLKDFNNSNSYLLTLSEPMCRAIKQRIKRKFKECPICSCTPINNRELDRKVITYQKYDTFWFKAIQNPGEDKLYCDELFLTEEYVPLKNVVIYTGSMKLKRLKLNSEVENELSKYASDEELALEV